MSLRSTLLLLVWLGCANLSVAQVSEEDDSESVITSVKPSKTDNSPDLARAARLIVEKTNDFRRKQALEPVKSNSELAGAAQYFANYMAKTDRYGHTADGSRPSQRAKEHGYEYCLVAENIAYQYSSVGFGTEELAEKFVQGWIDSPEHRKNMLNSAATETGVAISHSEESGHYYAVQMFGRPKSLRTEFRLSNESQAEVTYKIGDRSFSLPPRYTRTHMRCRSTEITLVWQEDSQRQSKTIKPEDGDQFVIAGQGEQLKIEKQ
jgi:uncharacterized protein YkwD